MSNGKIWILMFVSLDLFVTKTGGILGNIEYELEMGCLI